MEDLGYPDQRFDAVICVFAIFFLPDVAKQIRELWRMVRPNGQLAITTWGPRVWEPGSTGWRLAVEQLRPDIHAAFNPWDRIADPASLRKLSVAPTASTFFAAASRNRLRASSAPLLSASPSSFAATFGRGSKPPS